MFFNYDIVPTVYITNATCSSCAVGSMTSDGTYMNVNDYYIKYYIDNSSDKEAILALFENEVYFDEDDEESAEKAVEQLVVDKKENFYDYYD